MATVEREVSANCQKCLFDPMLPILHLKGGLLGTHSRGIQNGSFKIPGHGMLYSESQLRDRFLLREILELRGSLS